MNIASVPVLFVTAEASYHAVYDHCTVAFLRQAGVEERRILREETGTDTLSSARACARLLRERGFSRVAVAQETRLRIRELEFTGKEWQNVRTAMNKARKLGITAQWYRYRDMPPHLRLQLDEVSEEWASRKRVPEMGFTLGGLDELMDPNVVCCLALDGEAGVVSVLRALLAELDLTVGLTGHTRIGQIGPELLAREGEPPG